MIHDRCGDESGFAFGCDAPELDRTLRKGALFPAAAQGTPLYNAIFILLVHSMRLTVYILCECGHGALMVHF